MKNKLWIMPVCVLLCIFVAGCRDKNESVPLTDAQNSARTSLDSQRAIAAETARNYHALDSAALVQKLLEQSKAKKEPFNSLAYRELKGRSDVDSKSLVTMVKENDNAGGILPLLLLRKLDGKSYGELPVELKVRVLTDALGSSKFFNTWGLPGFYLQDASSALLETGDSATPALRRLLLDTRPAPVFGSQEYMIYQRYKFRVCDYALFYLERIQGKTELRLPEPAAARDAMIQQISKK